MLLAALSLLAVSAAAGCGAVEDREANEFEQELESALPGEGDVTVDPDTDSVTVEDETGSFTMGDALPRPEWIDPALPLPDDFAFETVLTVDAISAARGTTDLDVETLAGYYRKAVTELGWRIDGSTVSPPDFFQILTTDPNGDQLDIEFVQGKLGFVIGRARPDR